jgi:hypothetical protein
VFTSSPWTSRNFRFSEGSSFSALRPPISSFRISERPPTTLQRPLTRNFRLSVQSFWNSEVLLAGLVRTGSQYLWNLSPSLALNSTEFGYHFTKCLLYWMELRFRGQAPRSMVHRGPSPLRIESSDSILPEETDIWRKPVKDLGILGTGDGGTLPHITPRSPGTTGVESLRANF